MPRDEQERCYAVKRSRNANWKRRDSVVLAKVIFRLDGLVYFAVLRGEIFLSCLRRRFFPGYKATVSLLDFLGHLLDKHSPLSVTQLLSFFIFKQPGYIITRRCYNLVNSPRISISRYQCLFASRSLFDI